MGIDQRVFKHPQESDHLLERPHLKGEARRGGVERLHFGAKGTKLCVRGFAPVNSSSLVEGTRAPSKDGPPP